MRRDNLIPLVVADLWSDDTFRLATFTERVVLPRGCSA